MKEKLLGQAQRLINFSFIAHKTIPAVRIANVFFRNFPATTELWRMQNWIFSEIMKPNCSWALSVCMRELHDHRLFYRRPCSHIFFESFCSHHKCCWVGERASVDETQNHSHQLVFKITYIFFLFLHTHDVSTFVIDIKSVNWIFSNVEREKKSSNFLCIISQSRLMQTMGERRRKPMTGLTTLR